MNGHHPNAVAGPSSLRTPPLPPPLPSHSRHPSASSTSTPTPTFPLLFLPPPAPPPPHQHLQSTQDLLSRFHLLPAYDKYVSSPLGILGESEPGETTAGLSAGAATPGGVDKGKGRDLGIGMGGAPTPAAADVDMADPHDADDDDAPGGKGEKKRKNSYKHLIKGVPGKHSFKKDDYLTTTMLVPPKQRMRIHQFDERTREDAFTVSLEGLKGWNINALVVESAQAREDRKKRKEAKRVAKMQAQTGQLLGPTIGTPSSVPLSASTPIAHPQPILAPIPTPVSVSAASVRRTSTPQVGTPRATVGTPRPASRGFTANANGAAPPIAGNVGTAIGGGSGPTVPRPTSTVPRPGSAVPRPGSQQQQNASSNTTANAGANILRSGTPMDVSPDQYGQRGKKREREDGAGVGANGVNGVRTNGAAYLNGNGVPNGHGVQHQQRPGPAGVPGGGAPVGAVSTTAMNAKAGTGNIRPRPIKKQRVDVQGQARDVAPVQQPTPQGV